MLVTFANDGVRFPISEAFTPLHDCRTFLDGNLVRKLSWIGAWVLAPFIAGAPDS
uniref:Uncharacterized protein n=1 Tax=Candidatus Kentrum eta TaxID=2126337 RepID=A0A450UQB0_9GAMM|nr:MAG: hypothetical protein BECKH772A_GA0070896_100751 [Candidatus Kentron sp. H]